MIKDTKDLIVQLQMKLDRSFTTVDTELDTFATLENRFTSIDMKLDTVKFVTLQVLDTRLEKKVEDMKTRLGVLNDLEANIRELVTKVSSNKKSASSILNTAIQALNGSCDNGLRNYQGKYHSLMAHTPAVST